MLRDAAQAYIEVLLEKGGSVPVDEGVETGNMPVVTVTVKTSSAIRPLLTLTGVGGNVILEVLCYIRHPQDFKCPLNRGVSPGVSFTGTVVSKRPW